MTETPEPKKRGRPSLGKKPMTPAQRKARQRSQPRTEEHFSKERMNEHIIRDAIPYFVTSHIIRGTTWKPEYRAFWTALGIGNRSREQAEKMFFSEKMAKQIRDTSQNKPE